MDKILVVGLGGFIGAILRYVVSHHVRGWIGGTNMPWETLVVNLFGCLFIGLLSEIVETHRAFSPETRSFIFVGILGAFTTFSTFSGETMTLLRNKDNHWAFMNIALHLILGLGSVGAGRILAGMIRR